MSESLFRGGCRCGKVRFEGTSDSPRSALCACPDCQKAGGAPFGHAMGFKGERFQVTAGETFLKSYADTGESGQPVHRFFCQECGSPLFAKPDSYPGYVSVRVPALDQAFDEVPAFVIFAENVPAWITLPEALLEEGKKLGG